MGFGGGGHCVKEGWEGEAEDSDADVGVGEGEGGQALHVGF